MKYGKYEFDDIQGGISQLKEKYGLTYERKTIYSDIGRLQAFGMKIVRSKGRNSGYYVEERDFDLAGFICDAVFHSGALSSPVASLRAMPHPS